MKRKHHIITLLLLLITFTISCSDDKNASNVLFRPVTTMSVEQNKAYLSWKAVEGALQYIIDVYKVKAEGEELFKTEKVPGIETSRVISLDWEDSYLFKVKCVNENGVVSAYWETEATGLLSRPLTIDLGETRTIDTQARIFWNPNDSVIITALSAIPVVDGVQQTDNAKIFTVSGDEYNAGQKTIDGLTPETSYRINLYSGTEQTSDTYQAHVELTTQKTENLDEEYGISNRIDLRNMAFDENYFNSLDWSGLPEGTTFILPAARTYTLNIGEDVIELMNSVNFVTPQTLDDYATFKFGNSFRVAEGATVDKITFNRVNMRAMTDLSEATSTGLSGKQVICPEASSYEVGIVKFTDCNIENFRAIVRSKTDKGNFGTIIFNDCVINGMGDQAMVSTNGKKSNYMNAVSFNNCTITNICGIADLRYTGNGQSLSLTNCTFCYAPMETSYLFRVDPSVAIKIENCVFGGSMKVEGKIPKFDVLGSGGMDDYTNIYRFNPVNSFQTDDHTSTKGNIGLTNSKMSTSTLFTAPSIHNFKLNEQFGGASGTGALRWRR